MPLGPRHPFFLVSSIPLEASTFFFFLNIKVGTSNWPVVMQSCFALYLAGLICLTRSHEAIGRNTLSPSSSAPKVVTRRTHWGWSPLITSSCQKTDGSFSFQPSPFPPMNAIKL